MSELPPQEKPKRPKGIPTWVWFIVTFAVISVLGNVVLGGNTWINSAWQFVNNTFLVNNSVPVDTSKDPFCLSGEISEIDKENTLAVVTEADALVGTTTGAIGFASLSDNPDDLAEAINTVRESGPTYLVLGERLLTAIDCNDPTYEYLMKDFGDSLVAMGENFSQWDPQTLTENPLLLVTVTPLIEQAATKAQAIITFVENLE